MLTTPCGKKLVQTLAILRYLGNELNLYGKTNLDKQRIDAMIDFGKDIYDRSVDIIFDSPDEELVRIQVNIFNWLRILLKYISILKFILGKIIYNT